MKRTTIFYFILFASITLSISCKQANKTGALIPKDAALVIHINLPSLSSKLSWDEIKQTNWFKEAYEKATDSFQKKMMDNPDNSGLDTKSEMILFMQRHGSGGFLVFQGQLKDATAFENLIKQISRIATASSKDGDFTTIKSDDGIVRWNKNRFVYVTDAPMMNIPENFSMNQGPQDMDSNGIPGYKNRSRISPDTLVKFAKDIFELSPDNSMGKNEKFADMLKEPGDVHLWINAEKYSEGMGMGMMSMLKLNNLFEKNISASTLNFDNGKISIKSRQYLNDEMISLFKKYKSKGVEAATLNRIPSQNVMAVFSLNYPPEGLKEFMRVLGVDGMVNGFLGDMNFSVDEFIKANKGDVLVVVSDFQVKSKVDSISDMDGNMSPRISTKPDMKVLFTVSVKDRPTFQKMIDAIKGATGDLSQAIPEFTYKLNDQWFAAGNSAEQVDKFLAGGNTSQPFADKISGYPFSGYIDIQKILRSVEPSIDSSKKANMAESMKTWDNILFTWGNLKNGSIEGTAEVNLMDKNTNSLKQLNQFADKMAGNRRKPF